MPIRTPSAARRRARALEQDQDDPTGARKAAQLQRWAVQLERARAINEDENPGDADQAWGAMDDARLQLEDLGIEVAGEDDLRRPEDPSPARATPARSAARRPPAAGRGAAARQGSPSRRSGSSSRGRRGRSSRSSRSAPRRAVDQVTSNLPGAAGVGDLLMEALAATIGLAILLRLVDTKRGGPQIVGLIGQSISSGLRLLVDPTIDPLSPSSSVTATTAAPGSPAKTTKPKTP